MIIIVIIISSYKRGINVGYLIYVLFLTALYVTVFCLMKYMKNTKIFNAIFVVLVFALYLAISITVYLDVGFYDWNYQNTLPVANVSPFMFVAVPIASVLPKTIKKRVYLLVSLLSVGMFFSPVYNCIYNASINYKFYWHFTYDYLAHILLSLFGIYLIKSKQVELKIKDCLISGLIIIGVATTMLILNLIFDTAFFGLSLNGKHNIYNVVLVKNSYISALIYYSALCVVLSLGYFYCRVISKKSK